MQPTVGYTPLENRVENYALLEFDESDLPKAEEAFADCLVRLVVDGVVSQSQAQAASLWQLRGGSWKASQRTRHKNDLSVRISEVPAFLADVDQYVKEGYPDFEVCWYGHIGDGNLHLNILRPDSLSVEEFFHVGHTMSPKIFGLVQARRGSISAEHGLVC